MKYQVWDREIGAIVAEFDNVWACFPFIASYGIYKCEIKEVEAE